MPKPGAGELTAEQKLARSRLAADVRLKRADQKLAREQFEYAKRQDARTGLQALLTPTGGVFVAAALGLLGTAMGKFADNVNAKREQETSVILQASEVPATLSPEQQTIQRARNLLWFSRAHYIELPKEFAARLEADAKLQPGETLSAPVVQSASAVAPLATVTCENSAELVPAFETFSARVQTVTGTDIKMIGFGHELTEAEKRSGNLVIGGKSVAWAGGISQAEATQLLEQDMAPAYAAVDRLVKVTLTAPQRQALASFVQNVGAPGFERSALLKHINANDFDSVPDDLARWSRAGGREIEGLKIRRATEAAIWKCKG